MKFSVDIDIDVNEFREDIISTIKERCIWAVMHDFLILISTKEKNEIREILRKYYENNLDELIEMAILAIERHFGFTIDENEIYAKLPAKVKQQYEELRHEADREPDKLEASRLRKEASEYIKFQIAAYMKKAGEANRNVKANLHV